MPLLTRTIDGDPAAIRETFALVVAECDRYDAGRGNSGTRDMIDSWGDELGHFIAPA